MTDLRLLTYDEITDVAYTPNAVYPYLHWERNQDADHEIAQAQMRLDQSRLLAIKAEGRQEGRDEVLGKMRTISQASDGRWLSEADYQKLKEGKP